MSCDDVVALFSQRISVTICSPRLAISRQSEERETVNRTPYLPLAFGHRQNIALIGFHLVMNIIHEFAHEKDAQPTDLSSRKICFQIRSGISEGSNDSP